MDKSRDYCLPWGSSKLTSSALRAMSAAALLTAMGGCASQVSLTDVTIPDPLVERIPISVAVKFPDAFEHFVHQEEVMGRETWTIDLGRSNELLFTKLFQAMFDHFQVIESNVDPRDVGVDAWIEPSIDAFEFSVPSQSRTDAFAVWIRYRIKIFDKDGNQFANWPMSAYGKSQSTTMGKDQALRRAAVLAMRDAAALIVMQMDRATGISSIGKEPESSLAATPEGPAQEPSTVEPAEQEHQTAASESPPDETS